MFISLFVCVCSFDFPTAPRVLVSLCTYTFVGARLCCCKTTSAALSIPQTQNQPQDGSHSDRSEHGGEKREGGNEREGERRNKSGIKC